MIMDEKHLLLLIDKYFDGLTDLNEERQLREVLKDKTLDNPAVNELRAVLSYVEMASEPDDSKRKATLTSSADLWRKLTVAASVIMILGVAFTLLTDRNQYSECNTMIACRHYDSPEKALSLINSQLFAIGAAADDVADDIADDFRIIGESIEDEFTTF